MVQTTDSKRTKQLWAAITIGAKLNVGMSELANRLEGIGSLQRVSSGSVLKYAVTGSPGTLLEFARGSASVLYYFDSPSLSQRAGSLAMLLSLLAYAKGAYEVRFDSAYEVVIDMLHQMQHAADKVHLAGADADTLANRISALSSSNAALAHAILELRARNESALLDLGAYAEFFDRVVKSSYSGSLDDALVELGLSGELAERIRNRENGVKRA